MVDGQGTELARLVGPGHSDPLELARFYNDHRPKVTLRPAEPEGEQPEPGLTAPNPTKPWETAARIRVFQSDTEWGFGSGTIIRSTPEESIVLTCAHTYRVGGRIQLPPKDLRLPIRVDLFDGFLSGPAMAKVGPKHLDLIGELIDLDHTTDLALVRIRPGYELRASPVVPADWEPLKGMKMISLGASHGNDATAWDTKILDPRVAMKNAQTGQPFFEIKCANRPMEGRSGGGLFTFDGYLAGVCNFADPNEHVGLYAVPEAIHRILDRNGLSAVYGGHPKPTPSDDPKRWEVITFPSNPYVKRLDALPGSPDKPEPKPAPPVSDTDRRLADLERKLDRVVEALDNLGADRRLDGPIGDFDGRRKR